MNTSTKKSGSFHGKSNALGHGGRAAQLKAKGVPGAVIGMMARKAHAAPGQVNYHGHHSGKGTKARLNTAAQKNFFGSKHSK